MKICTKCKTEEAKSYSIWGKDCLSKANKLHYLKHKERFAERQRKYNEKNPKKFTEIRRVNNLRIKRRAIEYYTNGQMCCECCKEKNIAFLTLDHIDGKGSEHRKLLGRGMKLANWVVRNNFPKGFQILCYNCNIGKSKNKFCPHTNPEPFEIL